MDQETYSLPEGVQSMDQETYSLPEGVQIMAFEDLLHPWPLLVEAAPGNHLDITFTTDGVEIQNLSCSRLAVLSCVHEGQEMFTRETWVDRKEMGKEEERKRIIQLLRTVDRIPGWDGTCGNLLRAFANLLESDHDGTPEEPQNQGEGRTVL